MYCENPTIHFRMYVRIEIHISCAQAQPVTHSYIEWKNSICIFQA